MIETTGEDASVNMFRHQRHLLRQAMRTAGLQPFQGSGHYVAGGACTSVFSAQKINDLDLFFYTKDFINQFQAPYGANKVFESENADSYESNGIKFQVIKKVWGEPKDVIETFDFTIAKCAYDDAKDSFWMNQCFLQHLAQRVLVYCITPGSYPIASLWRMRKFIQRGFWMPAAEMIKLILRIRDVQIDNFGEMRDQIMGVDTVSMAPLLEALEKCKDVEFDPETFLGIMEGAMGDKLYTE